MGMWEFVEADSIGLFRSESELNPLERSYGVLGVVVLQVTSYLLNELR